MHVSIAINWHGWFIIALKKWLAKVKKNNIGLSWTLFYCISTWTYLKRDSLSIHVIIIKWVSRELHEVWRRMTQIGKHSAFFVHVFVVINCIIIIYNAQQRFFWHVSGSSQCSSKFQFPIVAHCLRTPDIEFGDCNWL